MRLLNRLWPSHDTQSAAQRPGQSAAKSALEKRTCDVGQALLTAARQHEKGMLSSQLWRDRLMNWAMQDEALKVQLFRFVDVFPMLRTPEQVHDYLVDYLNQQDVKLPAALAAMVKAGGVMRSTLAKTITQQIQTTASQFIVGSDAVSTLPTLEKRWQQGLAFSVDLLGEACVSDAEAHAYQRRYLDLIENLPAQVARWPANDMLDRDHLGQIPRTNVSIKISSLYARADAIAFEHTLDAMLDALGPVLEAAAANNVLINFDMEQHALKDLTLALFMRACERYDFPAGLAMQAYLRTGDEDAKRIAAWSRSLGRRVVVRLVKGAYWDYESIHAQQQHWPSPVWPSKAQTDACFERMSQTLIDATPRDAGQGGIMLAVGSHNARSIARALALLESRDLPASALEVQMLYGMAGPLKAAALAHGLRLREYDPVGEMIPGMAYLVRRLLENTSNESWLKAGFLDHAAIEQLLASPHEQAEIDAAQTDEQSRQANAARYHALSPAVSEVGDGLPFVTEPHRDFADANQREAFARAIAVAQLPAVDAQASAADVAKVTQAAADAFAGWRDTSATERANCLVRAAAIMRERRDELAGIMIREAGKTWREADGDVCEAIDFCQYYARQAVGLFTPKRLGKYTGEHNEQWYQPRGVAVVISPWNFPLAICTGMTTAALVTGNTVIVKPAEQTPAIARALCDILWQAGVPREVLHFMPGEGETVGAALVRDPRVALIAFTGSKAVGLDILAAAGQTPEHQPFIKKVICEMGGKNAIIIDEAADLDEAVVGVRQSAFSFAGQKCSACSRAIVVGDAYDAFVRRLVEATRSLVVGHPMDPATDVGPVIDEQAAAKIRSYIDVGMTEGKLALQLDVPQSLADAVGKPFIGPTIFTDITPEHRLAREEVFGPVLAILRAADFDHALAIANSTTYKLTGGVYSRKPAHIAQARQQFRVGNLYINRGITGALVGRQPFGGFGLSGVGSKAGGQDYLLQFVEPRAVCENTIRRGFAPQADDA